jgi:hypothetical protein
MDRAFVQAKLVEVLQTIQAASGLECPQINGSTKPIEELPQFDSKIWPVAIGMLAAELGVTIADDVNIFRQEKGRTPLTISESVAMIVELTKQDGASAASEAGAQ